MRKTTAFSLDDHEEQVPLKPDSATSQPIIRPVRPSRPLWKRVLFWLFIGILVLLVMILARGALRVTLCAAGISYKPPHGNLTLIGHGGSDFPYPPNSLYALRKGAFSVHYVLVDVQMSSDNIPFAFRGSLKDTTNGKGEIAGKKASYIKKLVVSAPTRDPHGIIRGSQPCEMRDGKGATHPCMYRIASIDEVLGDLPKETRFILRVSGCEQHANSASMAAASGTALKRCKVLAGALKTLFDKHFIREARLAFTSENMDVLQIFLHEFSDAKMLLQAHVSGHLHYSPGRFARMIRVNRLDGALLSLRLAALRPGIVKQLHMTSALRTERLLEVFARTVRDSWQLKVGVCAGVSNLVVAQPTRMKDIANDLSRG